MKRYSRKFQRMAAERMRTCENVGELARELRGKTKMPLQAARVKLTEINQLWVADITYIGLKAEFVHLEA